MTPDLRVAYLIAGSDWPKVDAAISRLRAHFPEESVEQFSAGGDSPVDVAGACNALGLFGGRRLVLVRNAEALDDDAVAEIVAYLADPAPDTVLALFGGAGITPKHPLAAAVAAVGDVRLFDAPERKQAADWVVRRLADLGVVVLGRRRPPARRPRGRRRRRPGPRGREAGRLLRGRRGPGGGRRAARDPPSRHQAVGHHRRLGAARRRRGDRARDGRHRAPGGRGPADLAARLARPQGAPRRRACSTRAAPRRTSRATST